jgi:plastocyanin
MADSMFLSRDGFKAARRMAALVALSAAVIACGGDSDDAVPAVTEAPVTTPAPTAAPTPGYGAPASTEAVSAADHVVVTEGFSFSPASLTIAVGETVEFQIGAGHNLVWSCSGDALTGTATRTFDEPGTYSYCCTNHEGMSGLIIVE